MEKIIQAIRRLLGSGISVSESISTQILDALSGVKRGASSMSTLTDREFEIYLLLGRGQRAA